MKKWQKHDTKKYRGKQQNEWINEWMDQCKNDCLWEDGIGEGQGAVVFHEINLWH